MKSDTSLRTRPLTSLCCICGSHLRGPWPPTPDISHGYCDYHFEQTMRRIAGLGRPAREERGQLVLANAQSGPEQVAESAIVADP